MGVALHEYAVFEGSGFHLVAVGHQVLGPDVVRPGCRETPFAACGETGAATAGKFRLDYDIGDLCRGHRSDSLAECRVTPVHHVLL